MEKGTTIIKIEKLIFEGYGLGHDANGQAIFVKKSVPGDELEIEIAKEKKNFKEGIIKKIIKPSPYRITPACPHFEHCGGCEHQNIAYKDQLKFKEEIFKEVLDRAHIQTEVLPIMPGSAEEFYYRNTQRFFISVNKSNELIYQMHDFADFSKLIEIKECLLQSEFCNQFMAAFKEFADSNIDDKSSLSQLRIREGKQTGDFMIELITKTDTLPRKTELVSFLKRFPQIKSAYHCISTDRNLRNPKRRLLTRSPIIYEKIGKFSFQISPESFFQTNSCGVKTLYDKIKEFAAVEMGDNVLDLFCGTGTIGIYLSTFAKKITGIEIVQSSINDAKSNAKINNICNTEFICTDAAKWMKNSNSTIAQLNNLTIIIDPPRQGLSKEVLYELSNFRNLIYVSCDPATFARDIKEFEKRSLKLKKVQPIDMFPQTHHIECVGVISR